MIIRANLIRVYTFADRPVGEKIIFDSSFQIVFDAMQPDKLLDFVCFCVEASSHRVQFLDYCRHVSEYRRLHQRFKK